jgi:6-phosphofructokinase 2
MQVQSVVTLTMNPAIDISTSTEQLRPNSKLRCAAVRRDPGGGGINVARVVHRLGGAAVAIYTAGGSTGELLKRLVEREGVESAPIAVLGETREDFTIVEGQSGNQFRFIVPGEPLGEQEWRACLQQLQSIRKGFIVASGSLPPSVPNSFYTSLAALAKERGLKLIVDASGPALEAALKHGVYLIKPNLRELEGLVKGQLSNQTERVAACRHVIKGGGAELVTLTLGSDGAILVTGNDAWRAASLHISVMSVVGAGDSFLGGMVWSLANENNVLEAFRFGCAAGAAAVSNSGTELCHATDVLRLYPEVKLVRV